MIKEMKNWIIKTLGGYTPQEFEAVNTIANRRPLLLAHSRNSARFRYYKGIKHQSVQIHTEGDNPNNVMGMNPSVLIIDTHVDYNLLDYLRARSTYIVDLR